MYEVLYHSHPDKPVEYNHIGKLRNMVNQDRRSFEEMDQAINFWLECSYPITTLDVLIGEKYDTELLTIVQSFYQVDQKFQALVEENEEITSSKKILNISNEEEIW